MSEMNIKPFKKAAEKGLAKSRNTNARRTVKRSQARIVKNDPMMSLRAYIADSLCGLNAPLNQYETGLQEAFKEFANMLHPAGYDRDRSMSKLIVSLRQPSMKCTKATLQNINAVRNMLHKILHSYPGDPDYPYVDRYLCGFEVAHWLLLGWVDPSMRAAVLRYLYSTLSEPPTRLETKRGLKRRARLMKSLQRVWFGGTAA